MLMAGTELRVEGENEWAINGMNSYKQLHVLVIFLETLAEGALYWKHMFSILGIHQNRYLHL